MPGIDAEVQFKLWEWVARGRDLPGFDELLARPEWHRFAACRGQGTDAFFPGPGESAEPAKAVCAGCSVIEACQRAGAAAGGFGVWGGESASQRSRAARAERNSAA